MQTTLDLYTDYLLSSFGQTSATGLSRLTDGAVGHNAVTDLFNRLQGDNRTLWQHVKPLIRQIQEPDGVGCSPVGGKVDTIFRQCGTP